MEFPIHRHETLTRDGQLGGMISVRDLVVFLAHHSQ
jgi:hypothetical protein